MALFYSDRFQDLSVLIPGPTGEHNYVRFRAGRLDTDGLPEELRAAAYDYLSNSPDVYEDDGSIRCTWPGCEYRAPTEVAMGRHMYQAHGGPKPARGVTATRAPRGTGTAAPVADEEG